jgi:hypothetical protein
MAAVQLRESRPVAPGGPLTGDSAEERASLLELLDRVLDKGVVLSGDITLSVAEVDLVYVGLRVLISSVEAMERQRASGGANTG